MWCTMSTPNRWGIEMNDDKTYIVVFGLRWSSDFDSRSTYAVAVRAKNMESACEQVYSYGANDLSHVEDVVIYAATYAGSPWLTEGGGDPLFRVEREDRPRFRITKAVKDGDL